MRRQAEVEREREKAELAPYKAQITPHFLFNTLNTLYGLQHIGSQYAVEAMERLIRMNRYMFANAGRTFITVGEEPEYIEQYISLQRLRLGETVELTCDCDIALPVGKKYAAALFKTLDEAPRGSEKPSSRHKKAA